MRAPRLNPFFYVLMAIILTSLVLIFANYEKGEVFGVSVDAFANVTLLSSILLFIVSGRGGDTTSFLTKLKYVAIWLLIAFALVLGYSYRNDAKSIFNRVAGELVPSRGYVSEAGGVRFSRSDDGHFRIMAKINGMDVPMMMDSGASSVTLTYEDAEAAGLDPENLSFSNPVSTANGRAFNARIWLKSVSVAGIEVNRVEASVAPKDALDESLLGMSYLNKLSSWTVSQDILTLEP